VLRRSAVLAFGLLPPLLSHAGEALSVGSLLREMCDRDSATYVQGEGVRGRLWSSYDRRSVGKGCAGWFANDDWSNFLRCETNAAGREESVDGAPSKARLVLYNLTNATLRGKPDAGNPHVRFDERVLYN